MTPLDQPRLRLPDPDFDRLMQAAEPVRYRTAMPFLRVAVDLGQHEWWDPACYIGSSAKFSGAARLPPKRIASTAANDNRPRANCD